MFVKQMIRSAPIVALAFGVSQAVLAQSTTTPSSTAPSANAPAKSTAPSTGAPAKSDAKSDANKLARGDRKFLEEAAEGGMAEVELGKLAQQKAGSDQVKQFGKRMADDHQKANDQLKQLAASKGVNLPTEMKASHRREYDKLQKLSGAEFDREYMKEMVSDHKTDVKEFQSTAKSAKDADIKNFAATTLPTLNQHLELAQSTENAVKQGGRSGGKPATAPGAGTTSSASPPADAGASASSQHAATPPAGTSQSGSAQGTSSMSQRSTGSNTTSK